MAKNRFYGVRNHPDSSKNGIYDSWDACSGAVKGASGVEYKGFGTREEAQSYCDPQAEAAPAAAVQSVQQKPQQMSFFASSESVSFDASRAVSSLEYLMEYDILDDASYRAAKDRIAGKAAPAPVAVQKDASDLSISDAGRIVMYVDGSYNDRTGRCGYGVYVHGAGRDLRGNGREFLLYGSAPMMENGRNVEGEVTAAWVGLEAVKRLNPENRPVTVYHDYEGIGKWADHDWRANKTYTAAYASFVDDLRRRSGMDITFEHVDGHTGDPGNEMVDRLAKMGCGLHFSGEAQFVEGLHGVSGIGSHAALSKPVHQGVDSKAVSVESDGLGGLGL